MLRSSMIVLALCGAGYWVWGYEAWLTRSMAHIRAWQAGEQTRAQYQRFVVAQAQARNQGWMEAPNTTALAGMLASHDLDYVLSQATRSEQGWQSMAVQLRWRRAHVAAWMQAVNTLDHALAPSVSWVGCDMQREATQQITVQCDLLWWWWQ